MARKIDDDELLEMNRKGLLQKDIAKHFGVSPVAVCKRLQRLLPKPDSLLDKYKFTPQQKQFCLEKAKGQTATNAALACYECSSRESAKVIGSNLMAKEEVRMAVDELMERCGLSRGYRVRKLKGHVDNRDPVVSLKALDMSFKLDGSYAPEKILQQNFDVVATSKELEEINAKLRELRKINGTQSSEAEEDERLSSEILDELQEICRK